MQVPLAYMISSFVLTFFNILYSLPWTDNRFMHETRRREVFTKLRVIKIFTWQKGTERTYAVHTAQPQNQMAARRQRSWS